METHRSLTCMLSHPVVYHSDPTGYSLSGSSISGIFQARILEWVAISFSRGSPQPRDRTHMSYVSCTGRWVLYHHRHLEAPVNWSLDLKP